MLASSSRSAVVVTIALLSALTLAACDVERERELGQGVHPVGWAAEESANFHGGFLREHDYPLSECQACHGEDFGGGDVGVSCSDSGACHVRGVDDCAGTCHGDQAGPLPQTGAHQVHEGYCQNCHPVPNTLLPPHLNQELDLEFTGLAKGAGAADEPAFDEVTETCSNTYCHGAESPPWTSTADLDCNGCHVQDTKHSRFSRVVNESTCADCHGGSPATGHLDGVLTISVTACNACHGSAGNTGAPPVALDGSTLASTPQVGAHRRHLDSLLPGRIGKVVACSRCHVVPDAVLTAGHLDAVAPADVDLLLGDYDPSTGRCSVDCHFDRDPGPLWSDDSGAERACDACHGFPPVLTRIGSRHPTTPADLQVCLECHQYTPNTHVNGEVDYL